MIVLTDHDDQLITPEPKDIPYLEMTLEKLKNVKSKKKIKKYLKEAYLHYRNIPNAKVEKSETDLIGEVVSKNIPIEKKIKYICGAGTVRGAVLKDVFIERAVSVEDFMKSKIHFCKSDC